MVTPEELDQWARAIEAIWQKMERGEKLKKSERDFLGPRVMSGVSALFTGARKMREKQNQG